MVTISNQLFMWGYLGGYCIKSTLYVRIFGWLLYQINSLCEDIWVVTVSNQLFMWGYLGGYYIKSTLYVRIFGWLLYQINSLCELLKLKQKFRKNKIVTGKTPLFVIDLFCTPHSTCLNVGFWQSKFVRKCYIFNVSTFN